MNSLLTIQEIESRFADEWILLEDPETDDAMEIRGERVRFHSKDRDEVYRTAVQLRPARFAMLFTGELPSDTAVVL
jgi:hypothetical protein